MALLGDNSQGGFLQGLQDPTNQGLLAAGLAMLANARGPNSQNAIGAGGLAGLQAFQGAQAAGDMQAYRKAQIQKLEQDAQKQNRIMAALGRITGDTGGTMLAPAGAPGGSPAPAGPLLAGAIPAGSPGLLGGAASTPGAGGVNLSLPDVLMLKAMGGPDLTDIYKINQEGFKREPGAMYRMPDGSVDFGAPKLGEGIEPYVGPDGRIGVRQVQGYSDANAAAKAAEADAIARAQGRYSTTKIGDGAGGQREVLTSDLPAILGGQGQPQAGAAPAAAPQEGEIGYTPPQAVLDARNQIGEVKAMGDQMLSGIGALRDHKGFESNYGLTGLLWNRPGGDAADAKALTDQLVSQGWLQMRDKLKGSGAITDYESKKAEQAWSVLNDYRISPKMAREQLGIIEKIVRDGVARAETKAFGKKPAEGGAAPAGSTAPDFSGGNFSSLWGG